jgi:sensor histidine kinase YesM
MEESDGIGVANTSERLKFLYGTEHRFELSNNETGGVTASLVIPFRTGADATTG